MSNIINKSNHPVEVKRIDIQIWTLRDEIEAAILKRIQENPGVAPEDLDIEDIKEFYRKNYNSQESKDDEEDEEDVDTSNLDSSGNPLDDDAMAMMAALGGGDDADNSNADEEAQSDDTDEDKQEDEKPEDEASEEDDEAAAMAAAMLADQGMADTAEDDDDAALAAAMLADQGIGSDSEDTTESKEEKKPYVREKPGADKITNGFILLADVQMDQIMFFAKAGFMYGQSVIIEFQLPNSFMQTIEVKKCNHVSRDSKIISVVKPSHRVQGTFLFKFENERSQLRNFLQSIEPEIPVAPKKLKKPSSDDDDDDDDFDDLGF